MPTIADIPRSRDDYGRYFVANSFLHFPILGVHGSFLLISGKVQNAVGWDTDSAAEDMWFGLEVCLYCEVVLLGLCFYWLILSIGMEAQSQNQLDSKYCPRAVTADNSRQLETKKPVV